MNTELSTMVGQLLHAYRKPVPARTRPPVALGRLGTIARGVKTRETIVATIGSARNPISSTLICKAIGAGKSTVKRHLAELLHEQPARIRIAHGGGHPRYEIANPQDLTT